MLMRTQLLSRSLMLGLGALLCFVHDAAADPIGYAEQGSEYVRVDFGTGTTETIGPLTQYFSVGAFVADDFSKEYAIAYPAGDLYSIDTATAETTLIGNTGISEMVPSAMQWETSGGVLLMATYPACDATVIYALDVTTGATQIIGSADGCLVGLAFDANDNAFSIDVAADTLVQLGTGTVGPLGFDVGVVSALFFDPSTGELYLIAEDVNTGMNGMYVVDTTTGLATLLAPWPDEYSAFALSGESSDTDTVFANGFDPGAASAR